MTAPVIEACLNGNREPGAHPARPITPEPGIPGPRVQHGFDPPTWEVVRRAKELGLGWRIGLEDVFELADGAPAESNAHLVTPALAL